jgi:hypothetical protein
MLFWFFTRGLLFAAARKRFISFEICSTVQP